VQDAGRGELLDSVGDGLGLDTLALEEGAQLCGGAIAVADGAVPQFDGPLPLRIAGVHGGAAPTPPVPRARPVRRPCRVRSRPPPPRRAPPVGPPRAGPPPAPRRAR